MEQMNQPTALLFLRNFNHKGRDHNLNDGSRNKVWGLPSWGWRGGEGAMGRTFRNGSSV
jgi:hypothetical protein